MRAAFALVLAVAVLGGAPGCGGSTASPNPDVTGTWTYTWPVREGLTWTGTLTLKQSGLEVTGTLGYPEPDPFPLEPHYRDLWTWSVVGELQDRLHLHAPAPRTAWDDDWYFVLTVGATRLEGPSFAGAHRDPRGTFVCVRQGL